MIRLLIDSSEVNTTWTPVSPQMSIDENSQGIPAASQPISAVLMKKKKVKEESKKVVLKLNIQKTKIMAPSPIT